MAIDPRTIPVGTEALYETSGSLEYHARRVSETELSWRIVCPPVDTAMAANSAYLALTLTTAAQNTAQIQHLTRMMAALQEAVMESIRREPFPR